MWDELKGQPWWVVMISVLLVLVVACGIYAFLGACLFWGWNYGLAAAITWLNEITYQNALWMIVGFETIGIGFRGIKSKKD